MAQRREESERSEQAIHQETGQEVFQRIRSCRGIILIAMYADIDSQGRFSLFELSPDELQTIQTALNEFNEYLEATIELIEGNDYIRHQKHNADRLLQQIKHIQNERL